MRYRFLFIIFLLSLSACSLSNVTQVDAPTKMTPNAIATAISATETHTPEAISPVLFSIQMFDAQNGWGTTEVPLPDYTAVQIVHTQDGGQSWQMASVGDFVFINATYALDAGSYLVVASQQVDSEPRVFHTMDGGTTWQDFPIPAGDLSSKGSDYFSLHFEDADHGWIAVYRLKGSATAQVDALLYQTLDGGRTWTGLPLTDPLDSTNTTGSIRLVSDQTFWIRDSKLMWFAAHSPIVGPALALHVSHDGGSSWLEKRIPIVKYKEKVVSDPVFYDKPIFLSDDLIYQVAYYRASDNNVSSYPIYVLLASRDGGDTWGFTPMDENWNGVLEFVSPEVAFAVCGRQLCVTLNGTQTWSLINSNLDFPQAAEHHISNIDFVNAEVGYAMEFDYGIWKLHKTIDGGLTWTELHPVINR